MTLRDAAAEMGISKDAIKARIRRAGMTMERDQYGQSIVTPEIMERLKEIDRDRPQTPIQTERTPAPQDQEKAEALARCGRLEAELAMVREAADKTERDLRERIAELRDQIAEKDQQIAREQTIAAGAQRMALLARNPSGDDMTPGKKAPEDGEQKGNKSATKAQQKKPLFWQRNGRK